jgi:hypothetical protein
MAKTSTSFKKGDPRINRKGRPKTGEALADKFRDALKEKLDGDYTKLDSLIDKTVDMALKGNQAAIEFVLARGWGKMIDRIEVTPKKEFDLTQLTDVELEQLETLQLKAGRKES